MNPSLRTSTAKSVLAVLLALPLVGGTMQVTAAPASADQEVSDKVTELTNLAADSQRRVYWTVPASGSKAIAIGSDGEVKGEVGFEGDVTDVEAVSFQNGRLYIGDIGDPKAARDQIDVYRLGQFTYGQSFETKRFRLVYPDGAHDAGAFAMAPSGVFYVITRGEKPAIYRTQGSARSTGGANKLQRVSDAPAGVGDALVDPRGRLVLRTANGIHVMDAATGKAVAAASLDAKASGEALARSLSGSGLVVGTAKAPFTLMDQKTPTRLEKVTTTTAVNPSAASSGSGSPQPAASAGAKESSNSAAEGTKGGSSNSTLLALGAAALLSLLAAAVVALRK